MTLKKCIVVDLDNTLWGGVVGEDTIALSLSPPGSYFVAFQQALRDLHDRGIILAINSRNNLDGSLNVIRNDPYMVLQEKHFAAVRVNWESKVQNIQDIAKELNIGTDSMVFLDDDPRNRAFVRGMLPEVAAPEMPDDPSQYVKFLHSLPYFSSDSITDEDKMRGNFYVTERLRKESEKHFADRTEFLRSLGIELQIFENDMSSVARLSQLTAKTNQFNIKKQPYTEHQIEAFIRSPGFLVYHAKALDKFGDHGIIAFAIIHRVSTHWQMESLLMSCRVFGLGIEDAFVGTIAMRAAQSGAKTFGVDFELTDKNIPAREFVDRITSNVIRMPDWIACR